MTRVPHLFEFSRFPLIKYHGGIQKQVISTKAFTIVRYVYPAGCAFPPHTHPNDQITIIERGHLVIEVKNDVFQLGPEDILEIPRETRHSTQNKRMEECVTLNIFHPHMRLVTKVAKDMDKGKSRKAKQKKAPRKGRSKRR